MSAARANGDDLTLRGLLFCGIGNNNAASEEQPVAGDELTQVVELHGAGVQSVEYREEVPTVRAL